MPEIIFLVLALIIVFIGSMVLGGLAGIAIARIIFYATNKRKDN